MRKLLFSSWVVAMLAVGLTGCRQTAKFREPIGTEGRWLIFNPGPAATLSASLYHTDWPSTEAAGSYEEQSYFQEEVEDTMHRRPVRFEGPYRRVTSVRIGRVHR